MLQRLISSFAKPGALKLTLAVLAATWGASTLSTLAQERMLAITDADTEYDAKNALIQQQNALIQQQREQMEKYASQLTGLAPHPFDDPDNIDTSHND